MCGISGVVRLGDGAPVSRRELQALNDAMRLRGPDDEGIYISDDGGAGLGHRRLSIIDLEGGHQPMANEDGQVLTVLNGEIYNFVELRERLIALGHHFRTRSDTEVIVHGYEQWGDEVVKHLDGMFALAIWDQRKRRLLLARDRFGKKPLCWFRRGGRLVFASTLTALLRHPLCPREIDDLALARYLALEFVPAPQTILRDVYKLLPSTALSLSVGPDDGPEGRLNSFSYYDVSLRPNPKAMAQEEAEEEVRTRLLAAVRRRLVADVPVGIFLSGGVDSSAVTWAAAECGARPRTFSLGFDDPSYDESTPARLVARHFGTEHIEERIGPAELLAVVPRLGEVLDEPMADGSIVPTYCLSRLCRRHVTVALGGDGGDELFAGYPMYKVHLMLARAQRWGLGPLLRAPGVLTTLKRLADHLPVSHKNMSFDFKVQKTLAGIQSPIAWRNYVWLGAFSADALAEVLGHKVPIDLLYQPISTVYDGANAPDDGLSPVLYQDLRLYMVHHILAKVDRASMANSLEVRAPLLDTAFVEFAAALPLSAKRSLLRDKILFKSALIGRLPKSTLHRPKKGFGMPIGAWLQGPLQGLCEELLDHLITIGLCAKPALLRLRAEHQAGQRNHRQRLWTLMILALWHKSHLGTLALAR